MRTEEQKQPPKNSREAVILAAETSSRVGSTALALGPRLLEEVRLSGPMQHSSELFPAFSSLLKRHGYVPADIDQVHIAIGPGSFTGLRIAVTLAKTMHLAHGVRIVTVDSLDVVAANLAGTGRECTVAQSDGPPLPARIAALFDAKRGQFYASVYQFVAAGQEVSHDGDEEDQGYCIPAPNNGLWQKVAPDALMTAREIIDKFARSDQMGLLGDGLLYHRDRFDSNRTIILPEPCWSPHAGNDHRLGYQKALAGRFADPLALTPFYLRGPEVTLRKDS